MVESGTFVMVIVPLLTWVVGTCVYSLCENSSNWILIYLSELSCPHLRKKKKSIPLSCPKKNIFATVTNNILNDILNKFIHLK